MDPGKDTFSRFDVSLDLKNGDSLFSREQCSAFLDQERKWCFSWSGENANDGNGVCCSIPNSEVEFSPPKWNGSAVFDPIERSFLSFSFHHTGISSLDVDVQFDVMNYSLTYLADGQKQIVGEPALVFSGKSFVPYVIQALAISQGLSDSFYTYCFLADNFSIARCKVTPLNSGRGVRFQFVGRNFIDILFDEREIYGEISGSSGVVCGSLRLSE